MSNPLTPERLLLQNKSWQQHTLLKDPHFFERLAEQQTPTFLWIGCSDSRVPADAITGTVPGQIFVARNIANLVVHTDLNVLSVLNYAVNVLKVPHVIVCGHHGCGGVRAAMSNTDFGMLNEWLRHIKDVYSMHREELDAITDQTKRSDRLVELNVTEQVKNLAKTSIIQRAWKERKGPTIHAWVYDLGDGILHELGSLGPDTRLEPPYSFEL